jgi:predicted nucleic acid-binding protein
VAVGLGLVPTGTLGVLDAAAARNLVDLQALVRQLTTRTTFRCKPALIDRLLERDARRRAGNG